MKIEWRKNLNLFSNPAPDVNLYIYIIEPVRNSRTGRTTSQIKNKIGDTEKIKLKVNIENKIREIREIEAWRKGKKQNRINMGNEIRRC